MNNPTYENFNNLDTNLEMLPDENEVVNKSNDNINNNIIILLIILLIVSLLIYNRNQILKIIKY